MFSFLLFFFSSRRRHTRYWRDWSSDVCSSDLEEVLAFPDKFGIEQLYPTAGNGPVWFLDNEDPENDDNFLMTSHEGIDLEEEQEGAGRGSFELDAETGTEEHEVRIHADSPNDEWKNVEMTGYFKLEEGNDQFTLIARQGPSYNDDGGCGAYGYYGMLSAEGDAYFKKKLFHHGGGYSDRTAVEENVVDSLDNRWIGIKMVVYDLAGGDVKLELWVDDGIQQNNWKKATEYVEDRKSTRLNSSHANISYAVFCLKKNQPPNLPDLPGRLCHRRR